jgi:thioredoxin-related protein/Tfp pilus assembly protein PilF
MLRTNHSYTAGVISFLACLFTFFSTVRAEESLWTTDFEAAKTKAKEEKKLLFVYFTGSDWCTWCKRLDKEVLDEEKFKTEAQKEYIFVELDYPHNKKLPLALETQNQLLKDHYKIRGWPTIIITDTDGKAIARTGYQPGGPEKYLEHLGEFAKIYAEILQMKSTLETVQGLERAKLLDRIIEAYVKLNNEADETATWSNEIIAIDSDNKAGLKVKYEIRILIAESSKLKQDKKYEEAKAVLDKVIAHPGASAQQKQDAYMSQAECFFVTKDYIGFVACLKKAIEAAPDGPKVESIKKALLTYAPMAEKQEIIVKIKADIEKAEGLDRAKLLDKLVEAQESLAPASMVAASMGGGGAARVPPMLSGMPSGSIDSESIEKWSKEIVALDADNKAGLKQKYELRALIAESDILHKQQKPKEAQAVIDKALALPNLTDEQKQNTLFLKANIYLYAKDMQNSLDNYKKALEVSPEGQFASVIKTRITMLEKAMERQKSKADGSDAKKDESVPKKVESDAKKDESDAQKG